MKDDRDSGLNYWMPTFVAWVDRVHRAVDATDARYPFIFYATDWLAFAHLMIAVAFIGPLWDPVRNIWVVQFGIIACVCVIPLVIVYRLIRRLEAESRVVAT